LGCGSMRRFWKSNRSRRICLPIVEKTMEGALRAVEEANGLADLIELRVDYLRKIRLEGLLQAGGKPLVVTNRRRAEGGRYRGDEQRRLAILREAADRGADFVDVEVRTERSSLRELIKNINGTCIILSFHDFQRTPPVGELRKIMERMIRYGADVAKIVTFARSWEDNLKVLGLIPYAQRRGQAIVTFCMGEKGKMSRIFSPLMGAAWTYASLGRTRASAPGQLNVTDMRDIWERLP
jgi:3-dehydroquinate dehydratase type I